MGESSPNTYGGECSPHKRKEMREEIHQGEQENDVKFTQHEKRAGVRVHRGKRKMVLGITMEKKKKSHRGMRVLKKGQLNTLPVILCQNCPHSADSYGFFHMRI